MGILEEAREGVGDQPDEREEMVIRNEMWDQLLWHWMLGA
jgi:hypothetical protein